MIEYIKHLEDRIEALENFVQSLQKSIASGYAPVQPDLKICPSIHNEDIESIPFESYTVGQTAEKLGFSDQTVRGWLRDGLLKGVKVGGGRCWRITEEAICEFARNGTIK